jgi:hypothetical protein
MSKKTYLTVSIIVVLIIVSVTAFYLLSSSEAVKFPVTVGVKVGDVFTYQLVGSADSPIATSVPDTFVDIYNVEYCRVEITKIEVPIVSYTVTWQFNNGTNFSNDGMVNLENGLCFGHYWNIYASNLTVDSLSRPGSSEEPRISNTQLTKYPDGDREINFLRTNYELYDPTDLTYTKTCIVYNYIYFDKLTGMMVEYKRMELYHYPEIILTVEYKLVSSNVIKVS